MTINLTQKERTLLQDQKNSEELCVKKYNDYASKAQSQQLKQLFSNFATMEQEHLNSINQILNGQIPQMNQQQGQQQQQQNQLNQQVQNQKGSFIGSQDDANLCNDMLMTEKYVSGAYDTSIFEMTDTNVRQVLNHIQKEEQEHGEGLYNYMKNNGMYNAK
ncbi:MAG: coat protein F [Clostridiales bacterium GWB2_37_7]|nr:MAG: coat protein F [Clostridiales bacterium GWB2_37_7]